MNTQLCIALLFFFFRKAESLVNHSKLFAKVKSSKGRTYPIFFPQSQTNKRPEDRQRQHPLITKQDYGDYMSPENSDSFVVQYLHKTFSLNKNKGWQSKFTTIQGYMYMAVSALFFSFPPLARTLFHILKDDCIICDGGIRAIFSIVFNIGFFYLIAGRSGTDQFTLSTGLNRIFAVALPAAILAYTRQIDAGLGLLMIIVDGGLGLLTLYLVKKNGFKDGFTRQIERSMNFGRI